MTSEVRLNRKNAHWPLTISTSEGGVECCVIT